MNMKRFYRDTIIVILAIISSIFIKIGVDDFFMGTIYTVSGIMFSIGISILVTFNLHGIKKKTFIDKIRANINRVRNAFIHYFVFSTIVFITERYLRKSSNNIIKIYQNDSLSIDLNFSFVVSFLIFYCIFYFILNFLKVQNLNNEIFDNTNTNS